MNNLFYFARIVPDGICIDSVHNGYVCHTIIDSSIVGNLEYFFNERLFNPELSVEPSNQYQGIFLIREVDDLIFNDHVFNFEFEFKDGVSQSFQTEQVFLKY